MQNQLFTPLQIRDLTLKNRIVLSPMLTYAAVNGHISDWHFAHLAKFAVGGVGLVFMESTKVDPRGCTTPSDPGLWKDEFIAPLKRITQFIQSYGAAAGIQLGHSGAKARNSVPWKGRAPLASHPGVDHGEDWELIGPSAFTYNARASLPREMTLDDIGELLDMWGQATARAERAGFDVLEIHGAHGYLLHQFLSPATNHRTDGYGGSLENRMRFALEVVDRVRSVWPAHKPLFYRISAVDEAGWTVQDSAKFCTELKQHGVDVIDCSSGGMSEHSITAGVTRPGYGYQAPYAAHVRSEAQVKTMAVGLIIHADQAEQILRDGQADLVAIGRELLNNPNWALDAAEKLGEVSPFKTVPENYGYWLEKRAQAGFAGRASTWMQGIDE